MLTIKPIDEIEFEDLKNFFCGEPPLDRYLQNFARQNHKNGIGKTYVALEDEHVVGFYTISMFSIEFDELSEPYRKGIPKYPIPVAKIGKLAVDCQYHGKRIGTALLFDALKKIDEASKIIAVHAIVVDAKNNKVRNFYERFGFITYKNELSLFLSMKTLQQLFKQK